MTSRHISVDSSQNLNRQAHPRKPNSVSILQLNGSKEEGQLGDGSFEYLSRKGKFMLDSIVEQPLHSLNDFFDSNKFMLLEADIFSLLKALAHSGNWERALLFFEWVVLNLKSYNVKIDNQVVELMVRILGRESQHLIASKLLDVISLEDYSLDVRANMTILHLYSRTSKYKRAISVFERMEETGLFPTLVTYNVMLDVYGKMGCSWDKILGLLDEMRSNGLKFDEFTCSTVTSACEREGLLNEAKEFFAKLKSQGYVPGTITYNAMLQVFGKAGIYSEALSILKEMEGAALIGTMMHKGVMPNAVTYTTVINAHGKAREEDQALKLFDKMEESGCVPNVCTYNAMLGMLGKKSRSEEMIKILCDMKSSGFPLTALHGTHCLPCVPDRDTFNTLIGAYGRCGSEINATKMYEEMIEVGFVPCSTTYDALLNALVRRGDWKAAESIILDMKNKGFRPNETPHSLMLQCFAKGGNAKGIEKIEKKIYGGRIFPSWVLLRTLVRAKFKCGALVGMERAFQELLRRGYKPVCEDIKQVSQSLLEQLGCELMQQAICQ
ncbi:hypothetical protein SLEP1_g47516 [Rubroshorea leprosula]|uniref:Pentatricopeptide repeat-containing protein n=1 Tax=Rubroshorea leprosula TaxID=152421 RepID=A0AAV5LQU4_9ROSI|nr:hypothetical protein SLEP1_g47516 [Rubroshorea leprosula]